jgi:hypothetical protein
LKFSSAARRSTAASTIDPAIITERGYRSIAPSAAADIQLLAAGAFSDTSLRKALH